MLVKYSLVFIALLFTFVSLEAHPAYTLKDLEALEKDKAYAEFFQHAQDIRPSERTDYWKEMVANMAEGYLKSLKQKLILKREDFQTTTELAQWSSLNENEFFRLHRADLSLKWFEQCLRDDSSAESQCWVDFTDFWQNPKPFLDLAPKLLRLLTPYLQSAPADPLNPKHRERSLVTEYFIIAPLMFSEIAPLQCQKPEIQNILWKKLKDEWHKGQKSLKATLNQYALKECWLKLKTKADASILQGVMNDESTMSYQFLKNFGLLAFPVDLAYALNYLLSYPTKGDTFNTSWAAIKSLRSNSKKREEFIDQIRQWQRLPGELFTSNDEVKKRAILHHLSAHFPDYVDYYAHTCLNFYTGEKSFPQGNPALHCKEFFTTAKSVKNSIPDPMIKKFESQFQI